ncbi:acyl-CoA dehydrogenase NM domain-like protein [Aureobasidium pullulans]|uniref:Acyl-CoA dehydrogenase NM domain-like protein n=1 Tax=Aureobasidium pullulans TaxID=5580 RepID=A0A4S8YQB5_AURPU|nr:acyl-CoA dehydrogenase NM domain-like protein [Aureobasidium pullulans]
MSSTFSKEDVQSHNKADNLWIIVDEDVYDLTKFQEEHPGGKKILQRVAGKDASKQFWKYHNEGILKKYQKQLQVGSLDSKKAAAPPTPPTTPPPAAKKEKEIIKPEAESGTVAPEPGADAKEMAEALDQFGDMIPGGDPNWYQSYHSPYFNQSHADLRAEVREWMENEIMPNITEWDEARKVPDSVYKAMGERGYLAGLMGVHYPKDLTDKRVKCVAPEKWDLFHEMLITDEISRAGSGGFVWNLIGGFGIGAPPVLKYGKKELVQRIMPEILSGDKRICLAITEPDAGSDVANLTCEAKLSEDGKHYIVNGEKKWITNGIWSDYFTTAVRTGGEGMNGVSVLLIERSFGGVSTRKMDCQGVWSSGTTYVTFEDVKVPVENLVGKENQGFKVLMTNFKQTATDSNDSHERIGIIIQCLRFSRVCYEESMKYAHKRRTFGKKLIEHPVIRLKLAHMFRQIEASYSWMENLIYQCQQMNEVEAMLKLGGAIAGLKAQATTTFEFCAREASQIFGGLSYSRGGQGAKVERLYRDVRAYAIPGGSEEIMLDLSIRQSLRVHKALGMKL